VNADVLLLAVLVGAALLAVWINARFPSLLPDRRGVLLVHLVASLAGLQAAPALMKLVPGVGTSTGPATGALLGLFLPALVYAFLSAVWVIRAVQGVLARS
jgi:hypothetical protein